MKSIFSERQLRARLLEALGWQMVGSGMWEKLSDTTLPDVRVDEDEVLEIEQKRIERIQEVFEALNDVVDAGSDYRKLVVEVPRLAFEQSDEQEENFFSVREKFRQQDILLCGMREDLDEKIAWKESVMDEVNKRLDALELASQQWKKLDGRLTTAERRQRTIIWKTRF